MGLTGRDVNIVGLLGISAVLSCAIISYCVQLACFVKLRAAPHPEMEDVFTSSFGIGGSAVAIILCVFSFVCVLCLPFSNTSYLYGLGAGMGLLAVCVIAKEVSLYSTSAVEDRSCQASN